MQRATIGFAFASMVLGANTAAASPTDMACGALLEARAYLISMTGATEKPDMDALKAKVHDASARLDAVLAGMMSGPNAAKATEFNVVWTMFKNTRETGIIPAIYAGRPADAKAIATGIQAERMGKMKDVMGCN